jgi:hypothetical protein
MDPSKRLSAILGYFYRVLLTALKNYQEKGGEWKKEEQEN